MHPVHDVDALLLLALALSAKKRPAELVEIIAGADLIQGVVPSELRLVEAFQRLSTLGLICEAGDGFTLTPKGQTMMTGQPRKADPQARLFGIKEKLSTHDAKGDHAPILLTAKQVCAAILAQRTAKKATGKNILIAKPKVEGDKPGPGLRQRKPIPARRRKA